MVKDNEILISEINLLREKITKLEHSHLSINLPNFDLVKESRDRLLEGNNYVLFNVIESISDYLRSIIYVPN